MRQIFDPYGPGLATERGAFDLRLREAARSLGASLISARARALSKASCMWQIRSDRGVITAGNLVLATGAIHSPLIPRDAQIVANQTAFLARGLQQSTARSKRTAAETSTAGVDDTLRVEATGIGSWYALPAPDGSAFVGVCTQARPRALDRAVWFRREVARDAPDLDLCRRDVRRLGRRRMGALVRPLGGSELDRRRQRRVQSGSAEWRRPVVSPYGPRARPQPSCWARIPLRTFKTGSQTPRLPTKGARASETRSRSRCL